MKRIIVAASLFVMALAIFSCDNAQDPLGNETLMAPGAPGEGNNGALPHDGACVAYCARAIIHEFACPHLDEDGKPLHSEVPMGDPDFHEDDWQPVDVDGDGKIETCLREYMCHKWSPGDCPEFDGDGDGVYDRCVQPGDGWGFWCRLMHGKNTH